MTAETIATGLGGRKAGSSWTALCPAHDDRDPSLSLQDTGDGKVLVYCHAGCTQSKVIAALRARGLWNKRFRPQSRFKRQRPRRPDNDRLEPDDAKRTDMALEIWERAAPGDGTLVEDYLRSRGIYLALPPVLRFHAGLRHPSGSTWPAMVALVTRGSDDLPVAIHRTFLARDGSGKASVERQQMMLGPCRGGAVRLAPANEVLMVGEGIETCLAAMQATGIPAWAALSISGLRALTLPVDVREVIVLADADQPGETAARDTALRWKRKGHQVRIARPPQGLDFNDLLQGQAPRHDEDEA